MSKSTESNRPRGSRPEPEEQASQPGACGAATVQAGGMDDRPEAEAEALGETGGDYAEQLARAEAEITKLKNDFLRALADAENTRRRAAREKEEAAKYAISKFARDLLFVADNLERALEAVDPEVRSKDPALDALVAGVEMTHKELLSIFKRYGVTPIKAENAMFDPHVHEAIYEIPDDSVPNGTVLRVEQRGYMIHDRPLRPAQVGVSRGGPKREPGGANRAKMAGGGEVKPSAKERASAYEQRSEGKADQSSGSQVDEEL